MNIIKLLTVTALGTSLLVLAPVEKAKAGGGGAFLGGVAVGAAGAIIGHKIYKHQKRKKARRYYNNRKSYSSSRKQHSGISSAQRAANADIQNRLNVLAYDAGTVDGIMGRRTRGAIRSFQSANNLPITGKLSNQDIALLYQQSEPILAQRFNGSTVAATTAGTASVVASTPPPSAKVVEESVASTFTSENDLNEPIDEFDEQPRVLGLAVKDGFTNALETLNSEGFSQCASSGSAISCEKATSYGSDRITVASSGEKIHTITRELNFETPVNRETVLSRLPASYKPILESEENTIAASPACDALLIANPQSFDDLAKESAEGKFNANSTAFSHACKYYFTMSLPQGEQVDKVGIVFFDSSPILASLSNGSSQGPAKATDEIKF